MLVFVQLPLFWQGLNMSQGLDGMLQLVPIVFWPGQAGGTKDKVATWDEGVTWDEGTPEDEDEASARTKGKISEKRKYQVDKLVVNESVKKIQVDSLKKKCNHWITKKRWNHQWYLSLTLLFLQLMLCLEKEIEITCFNYQLNKCSIK